MVGDCRTPCRIKISSVLVKVTGKIYERTRQLGPQAVNNMSERTDFFYVKELVVHL